jgi:hypothetical protein
MSGGITQLVATGVQDAYLSGTPEVSFFRSSYKRYTHFAATVERQLIQGTPSTSGTSLVRFEKKGDLLSHVYFTLLNGTTNMEVPTADWSTIIDKVELLIGGQIIDTQDYPFMAKIDPVTGASTFSTRQYTTSSTSGFFPLKFSFCKDWQTALPLVALQYHDVELRITWSSSLSLGSNRVACWGRFLYLDKDEREYFAKKSHDILITQVNRSVITDTYNYEFALSQPVKYIAFESNNYTETYNTYNASTAAKLQFKTQINGNDIGETRSNYNWSDINQYYLTPFGYKPLSTSAITSNVAIIPFCLDTSKLQPTGTLNFSRIDTFRLIAPTGSSFKTDIAKRSDSGLYFYAVNYNILRIQNGMAGILYAS